MGVFTAPWLNMLRIAQVSDLHIPATAQIQCFGCGDSDARANFLQTLATIRHAKPDLVVLSGDLAATAGEVEAYVWLAEVLRESGLVYEVMAGNHDVVANLRAPFALRDADIHAGLLYFSRIYAGLKLIFLDSAGYFLDQAQLAWLRAECAGQREVLLFIHHPPLYCGCPFMDARHALRNINEVWPQLAAIPALKHIFCGHYHSARSLECDAKHVHLTPSTMMEISCLDAQFHVPHSRPGWRWIEWDGVNLRTQVVYGA
jgi:3',5'-cyclic-AMP phosphodiesterase